MRTPVALSLLIAGLLPVGSPPLASCPSDTLIVCSDTTTSIAPSYSVLGCAYSSSGASYDLAAGQVSAGANGPGTYVALTTEDIYTLTGPGSIGPIAFSAKFAVRIGLMWYGFASAEIRSSDGAQQLSIAPCGCFGAGFSQTLLLPLAHAEGEPFRLALSLRATSPNKRQLVGKATATGELTFDLPQGYSVTSCQGYPISPTVVQVATWGRVKTLYR